MNRASVNVLYRKPTGSGEADLDSTGFSGNANRG